METRRRRRPALSCVECRRRKVKCDRLDPCKPCLAIKLNCTYKAYRNSDPQPRSTTRLEANLIAHDAQTGSSTSSLPGHTVVPAAASSDVRPDSLGLLERIENLERTLQLSHSAYTPGRTTIDGSARHYDRQPHAELKKTRLLKWSDAIGVMVGNAPEFSAVIGCYSKASSTGNTNSDLASETDAVLTEIGSLLDNCKQISRSLKLSRSTRGLALPIYDFELPDRDTTDEMISHYFEVFESVHRILHAPTFMAEYADFWSFSSKASTKMRLKVMLVVLIGSAVAVKSPIDRTAVEHWVYTAETWLAGPLEKDRLDLSAIQIHCLTLLARQMHCVGSDLVWTSMGGLTQKAIQIGLHRDPSHLPPMSMFAAEMRRRLWATIVEMTLQESLDTAMPTRISMDDFDTLPPADVDDEELDERRGSEREYRSYGPCKPSIQLRLVDSFSLRMQIIKLLNDFKTEISYHAVLSLTEKLLRECRAYTTIPHLKPIHLNLLDFHIRRFLIPLNASFAAKARSDRLFHYSYTIVIDSALDLMLQQHDEQFFQLMTVAGGMFRESIRYASTWLCLQLLSSTKSNLSVRSLQSDTQQRQPCKCALQKMLNLTRERVERGETNVKNHMFLSMVLAEVNAFETGGDVDEAVRQSARASLQVCLAILQKRLDGTPASNHQASTESDFTTPGWGWDLDVDPFLADMDLN